MQQEIILCGYIFLSYCLNPPPSPPPPPPHAANTAQPAAEKAVWVQMMLLVANIARYDLPREWPGLLSSLSEEGNGRGNQRALRALKHVIRALKGKRAVPDAPNNLISLAGEIYLLFKISCYLSEAHRVWNGRVVLLAPSGRHVSK